MKNCVVIPAVGHKPEHKGFLEDLLNSLKDFPGTIIVALDQVSDAFRFYFEDNYPNVTYIVNEGNRLGFAPNSNRGLRYAFKELKADRVMLCNQDTLVPRWEFLQDLFKAEGLLSATSVENEDLETYNQQMANDRRIQDVEKFAGYCFVIHKDVVEKIGYLDERFVSSMEDDEFLLRCHLAGFPVRVVNVIINHKGSHIDQNALGGSLTGAYNGERLMLNLQKYYWKYQIPGDIPHAEAIKWYTSRFTWQPEMYEP